MGRDSGKHALMSGAAARAHLIALPGFKFTPTILGDIAQRLNEADHALIIAAEGYERDERAKFLPERVDAAMYLKRQLVAHGLKETPIKRVITEPFSRYLRGIRPLYLECAIAFLKAFNLFDAFDRGESHVMPFYLGERDHGICKFDELVTENAVDPRLLDLIDRFQIKSLRDYVAEAFKQRG